MKGPLPPGGISGPAPPRGRGGPAGFGGNGPVFRPRGPCAWFIHGGGGCDGGGAGGYVAGGRGGMNPVFWPNPVGGIIVDMAYLR